MKLFKAFTACFSTYSRIPMPRVELDSDDMKYALIFFPFIGVVIGGLEYCLFSISVKHSVPVFCFALLSAVIPLLVTGGIHVDGFMDAMDAFNSYGEKEKKLEIMKDPHTGGFAVIKLATFGMAYVAFAYLLNKDTIIPFAISFMISRTLSGISVCLLKGAKQNGMLHALRENTENKIASTCLILFLSAEIVVLLMNNAVIGLISVIVIVVFFVLYKKKCYKEFGGITGDTSGYYLCMMELMLLVAAVIGGRI